MTDLEGAILAGRYRVESLLGRGGMADVYRGTDVVLGRPIAIKILTDRSDTVLRRFLREAQSMASLNHRNIVAVYDAGQADGVSYIVMEYVAGRTLGQIAPDELTMHAAIRCFIDLLEALAYAHDQHIIHRDVKPPNVMIAADGTVKVMDFGMSRRTSEMSSETHAGEIVGTIAYLAPERFLGKVADARSDLYSVGIIMYEVFTGRLPFENASDDLVAVIFAHVNEQPVSLRTLNRSIPKQIDQLVLQLLEKDPELRFGSARDVIAELRALIGDAQPLLAGSPRPAPAAAGDARPRAPDRLDDVRDNALERPAGKATTLNVGYSNTLAGMLAARKRDYPEASRTYLLAMRAFTEIGNDVEHAKTAIKYAAMILQKNGESQRLDRREVEEAAKLVTAALVEVRSRRMLRELHEGEHVLHELQRLALRFN